MTATTTFCGCPHRLQEYLGARVEALQRNQAFIDQYRDPRDKHLARREAIFPAGTWWLRRFAGVKCADVGESAPPS
jgi:hypothetical protein